MNPVNDHDFTSLRYGRYRSDRGTNRVLHPPRLRPYVIRTPTRSLFIRSSPATYPVRLPTSQLVWPAYLDRLPLTTIRSFRKCLARYHTNRSYHSDFFLAINIKAKNFPSNNFNFFFDNSLLILIFFFRENCVNIKTSIIYIKRNVFRGEL